MIVHPEELDALMVDTRCPIDWRHMFDDDSDVTPATRIAYDAFISGDARAMSLLVGLPATIGIACDSYAAEVIAVTRTTITARWARNRADKDQVFRFTKHGWRSKGYRLAVGFAETRLPQEV